MKNTRFKSVGSCLAFVRSAGRLRCLQLIASIVVITLISRPSTGCATDRANVNTPPNTRPNIVIILADDMGYGDVHCLSPDSAIPTPNLDALAASGMTFTDAHTPSAVCTPTRYGLLTGRYCWRSRLKRGVQDGYGPPLIESERPTIASFLRSNGYRTGIVGKWHLGLGFEKPDGTEIDYQLPVNHGPNSLGFDSSFIIPASLDFPPYVYIRDHKVTAPPDRVQPARKFPAFLRKGPIGADFNMENCLDHLLETATGFIRESATDQQPFLLYFPLTAPHKPVLPHQRFRGATNLGPYGDFIAQVDWTVGQVTAAIDAAGIRDTTLVIYTSDNGSFMRRNDGPDEKGHVDDETIQAFRADRHRSNGVFRGTKADIWEAGHHVPFFVRWPGRVEAGSTSASTICLTDVFATAADILTQPRPAGAAPDSFSFLDQLTGKPPRTPRPPVIHHSSAGMFAIRDGQWKLVLGNGSGGRENPKGQPFARPFELFDLETDLTESMNLIASEPDRARNLEQKTQQIRANERLAVPQPIPDN